MTFVPSHADMHQLLVDNLHNIRRLGPGVIVHIPRSGTIPASILATYLGWPLCSVQEFCESIWDTPRTVDPGSNFGNVILVDDLCHTGKQAHLAMQRIRRAWPHVKITYFTVYSAMPQTKPRVLAPHLTLKEIPCHGETYAYTFPWFVWKSKQLGAVATDMDGVLCRDCTSGENDDGVAYGRFLRDADLKFKPLYPIGAIITSRLTKYAAETRHWLDKQGVRYNNLYMGPWENKAERRGRQAEWKAAILRARPDIQLYIESSQVEAQMIHNLWGGPVWCVDNSTLYGVKG